MKGPSFAHSPSRVERTKFLQLPTPTEEALNREKPMENPAPRASRPAVLHLELGRRPGRTVPELERPAKGHFAPGTRNFGRAVTSARRPERKRRLACRLRCLLARSRGTARDSYALITRTAHRRTGARLTAHFTAPGRSGLFSAAATRLLLRARCEVRVTMGPGVRAGEDLFVACQSLYARPALDEAPVKRVLHARAVYLGPRARL